jgi:hypothetical protein
MASCCVSSGCQHLHGLFTRGFILPRLVDCRIDQIAGTDADTQIPFFVTAATHPDG